MSNPIPLPSESTVSFPATQTDSGNAFMVSNTSLTGRSGVRGSAAGPGCGVIGTASNSGAGVMGISSSGAGVYGDSTIGHGIEGKAYTAGKAGVKGTGTACQGGNFSSASDDGAVGSTNVSNRSGVVGINNSGTGAPGVWTNAQTWSAGYNINSSRDMKEKFEANPYGADHIAKLKPASYVLKGDPTGAQRVGLIAEDVEAVMPLAVSEGPDGVKGIDMYALNVALIATVQELAARLAKLEATAKA